MRSHRPRLPMDMGVFLVVLWFILVPYYLWHYERWRGLAKMIALAGIYFLSWILGTLVALVLSWG